MNDERLDYLIQLQQTNIRLLDAVLKSNEELKAIGVQNNILLCEILGKYGSPEEDMKDIMLDIVGNLAAYKMVGGKT